MKIIQERDLQKQIKDVKDHHASDVEKFHHERQMDQCDEYDVKESYKQHAALEKRLNTQNIIKNQHDEFKTKHIEILQEEILEGEIIKRKVAMADAKAKSLEEQRRFFFLF